MTQPKLAGILFCLTRGKERQSSYESSEFEIFLGIGTENELIKFSSKLFSDRDVFPLNKEYYIYDVYLECYDVTEEGRIPWEIGTSQMKNWKAIHADQLPDFHEKYFQHLEMP